MKIEHVAMYVKDLEAARDFFIKYFTAVSSDKYRNQTTGFQSYFLSFEDGSRLEIMNNNPVKVIDNTTARLGLIHIAFAVGSKEKVEELTNKLASDGYKVISGPRTTGDGYYESCILDLEGNQIEITV